MTTLLGLYDTDKRIINMQRFLNETLGLKLKADGNIGKITQSALAQFQASKGINETDEYGAAMGPQTEAIIAQFADYKYLTESDYVGCAQLLDVPVAVVKAVTRVEAKQFGFLDNGRPVILFERHKFYKDLVRLKGQKFADGILATRPDICNTAAGGYIGGEAEYKRYDAAVAICEEAAMLSTSWGLFQIMGFNYKQAGFDSVQAYVTAMHDSEDEQLKAFCMYIKNDKDGSLHRALQKRDWAAFAKEYNGPAYEKNNYDTKLESEYQFALKH